MQAGVRGCQVQIQEWAFSCMFTPVLPSKRMLTSALATIVTYVPGKVRLVQANCDPSDEHAKLIFTLRAEYNLNRDNYDKKAAYSVMKWILIPPEPARGLPVRCKK